MLDSISADGLTLTSLLISSLASIVLGLVAAYTHIRTSTYTKHFAVALVVLPVLVMSVMMMVNGNLGIGVAILGAFSLVRFRSIPGTSREIVSVFFAMAIGLATGTGYIGFAVFITVIIALVLFALHSLKFFDTIATTQSLKITMPEDVDHELALTPVFERHEVQAKLEKMKTKNMGSLFELTYAVTLPVSLDRKQFLNDLRVRNNNLAIVLAEREIAGGL